MLPTSNSRDSLLKLKTSNYLLLETQVKREHGKLRCYKILAHDVKTGKALDANESEFLPCV